MTGAGDRDEEHRAQLGKAVLSCLDIAPPGRLFLRELCQSEVADLRQAELLDRATARGEGDVHIPRLHRQALAVSLQ